MTRRRFILGASALAVTVAACGRAPDEPAGGSAALFNESFPDTSGTPQALSQWRGKPLLVNFWATWCAPCVKEMPDLEALSKEFAHVAFVGIGIDSPENIALFLKKVPVSYTLLEARSRGLDLMRALGNQNGGLPYTVIFDAEGGVIRAVAGQIRPDDLRTTLARIRA